MRDAQQGPLHHERLANSRPYFKTNESSSIQKELHAAGTEARKGCRWNRQPTQGRLRTQRGQPTAVPPWPIERCANEPARMMYQFITMLIGIGTGITRAAASEARSSGGARMSLVVSAYLRP